ncbi:hypothetical protein AB6813_05870 [bacterium RCC_150]
MSQIIRHPSAWVPVAMSLAILIMIVATLISSGVSRQPDEGAAAHIFQIWLVVEVLAIAAFAVQWVPRRPKEALIVLAVQVSCALSACAPIWYFGL